MALFKIMRGDSSRISTDVTAFHDGYAYFTPDDGGFYIDAEYNGEQKRYRINPIGAGSVAVNATLLASGWSAGQQTIEVQGVSPDTNGFIGLSQTVTDAEMESAKNAELPQTLPENPRPRFKAPMARIRSGSYNSSDSRARIIKIWAQ